ncbi:MAG: hypothetical protein IPJ61_18770 [Tessaracoccus sp.]|uniref:hypothetical protein n=1 Tax=Tessaracoccus sp. TaxID=1971211 RepID=UPI001ED05B5A|nr:hypothetical protein [Tessaracoccus sp.]MBK7823029.1 hypothetical protein [Tessaracoccus sp.]
MNIMYAPFNTFEIQMTADQARSASQPGRDALSDVRALLRDPKIARQLRKIDPEKIRAELKEHGAWDAAELADDNANRERIIWIAAGNITEDLAERGRGRGLRGFGASMSTRTFDASARAALAAVKAGDCAGAATAAARARQQATTPHQRTAASKLQHKVLRCKRRR